VIPQNVQVCAGSQVFFNAGGAASYTWANQQTGPSVLFSPAASGVFTVTGQNNSGCKATASFTITVLTTPTISVLTTSSMTCPGQSVTLTGSGGISYTWSAVSGTPAITVSPFVSTLYTVSGSAANGCTASATHLQAVEPFPVVTVLASSEFICEGTSVILAAAGAASYIWSNGAQLPQIIVTPQATTVYTVIGSSAIANCKNTAIVQVTVSKCTALEKLSQLPTSVFPNPFTSSLFVKTGRAREVRLAVTDLSGRRIVTSIYTGETVRLDLASLSPGVYFLEVFDGDQREIHKIIKTAE
jgi:hypothetical protein